VPFLNLVRPFQVMREIWKASDPEVDPLANLVFNSCFSADRAPPAL